MAFVDYYINTRHEMLEYLPEKPIKTIEFGCGNGNFSALIKKKYYTESWGVDINEKAAEFAETKLDKIIIGDAMEVINKLPENYFDSLICNDFLEHLPYPDLFLQRIRKTLTRDAFITCSLPNVRSWGHFINYFFFKDWKYIDEGVLDKTHLRFFTLKSLKRFFNELNIEIEIIKGITPTNTVLFNITNLLSLGFISDMRYLQFAIRGKFK